MAELIIREMLVNDIGQVVDVEERIFPTPWPEEVFHHEIVNNDHAHYFVATVDKKVIGYAGMWVVIDDVQITNIAILSEYRGYKIGEKLFQYVCQQAVKMGSRRLSLEVRASNEIAQRMYRKFGLVPGGIRKKYYTDNQEDAIVMWVNLQ